MRSAQKVLVAAIAISFAVGVANLWSISDPLRPSPNQPQRLLQHLVASGVFSSTVTLDGVPAGDSATVQLAQACRSAATPACFTIDLRDPGAAAAFGRGGCCLPALLLVFARGGIPDRDSAAPRSCLSTAASADGTSCDSSRGAFVWRESAPAHTADPDRVLHCPGTVPQPGRVDWDSTADDAAPGDGYRPRAFAAGCNAVMLAQARLETPGGRDDPDDVRAAKSGFYATHSWDKSVDGSTASSWIPAVCSGDPESALGQCHLSAGSYYGVDSLVRPIKGLRVSAVQGAIL
eukprot:m51a1_g5667 hypothetical protein (291) ;mRNA; r:918263-919422